VTETLGTTAESAGASSLWRPRYHVGGARNWVNDPNGPIHHDGRYHLFFQANEQAPFWGPPSWGHVSSTDLVTWERHPLALAPEPGGPDADGCWSGCALILDGRPAIYYTGVVGFDDERVESACRAWGSADLTRWERDPANPLIAGPPPGRASGYHRDPLLWRDGDGWHMLLGSGTVDGDRHGQVLRYDSPDAAAWTYGGVFFEAPRTVGGVDLGEHWECPQLVWGVDGTAALLVSCQVPGADRPLMHSVAFVGAVRDGRFDGALDGVLDFGDAFYAPAVCRDAAGRTLVWGWLQERLDAGRQAALSHAGALSLPCEARLEGGTLRLAPVPELAGLRRAALARVGGGGLAARAQVELQAVVEGRGRAGLALCADGGDTATVVVDADRGVLEVAVADDAGGPRTLTAPLAPAAAHVLRVFADGSALEVFADGLRAISTRCYPRAAWQRVERVEAGGARLADCEGWVLGGGVVG
jgi:beta-fructofuranosidase